LKTGDATAVQVTEELQQQANGIIADLNAGRKYVPLAERWDLPV
jgi:hypothetical protein